MDKVVPVILVEGFVGVLDHYSKPTELNSRNTGKGTAARVDTRARMVCGRSLLGVLANEWSSALRLTLWISICAVSRFRERSAIRSGCRRCLDEEYRPAAPLVEDLGVDGKRSLGLSTYAQCVGQISSCKK